MSFTLRSHDEWDIARQVNSARREEPRYCIPAQLGVFFDGGAVSPAQLELPLAAGNVKACPIRQGIQARPDAAAFFS